MSSGAQPAIPSSGQWSKKVTWIVSPVVVIGVVWFILFVLPPVSIVITSVIAAVITALIYRDMWVTANTAEQPQTLAKDTSSYIQSCITVMAIIVGAGWAAYVWKTQWDENMPALQVNLCARQAHPPDAKENERFIAGDVIFKNAGTRRTKVWLANGPLFIAKVIKMPVGTTEDPRNFNAQNEAERIKNTCNDGKLILEYPPQRFWLSRPRADDRYDIEVETEIRPGEQDDFHFLVRVPNKGTYAVMFSSELSEEDEKKSFPYPEHPVPCLDKNIKTKPRWESAAYFVDVQ